MGQKRTSLAVINSVGANALSDINLNTKLATDKTDKRMFRDEMLLTEGGRMFEGRYTAYDEYFNQWNPEVLEWGSLMGRDVDETKKEVPTMLKDLIKSMAT